tara:strand:- start:171 stop:695 length:525 start_codon:yes stop_codon:yes gene_type:complete
MNALTILLIIAGVVVVGEGVVIGVQVNQKGKVAQEHQEALGAKDNALLAKQGELSTCMAKTTPEALAEAAKGTTEALEQAMAPELAEVGLRAALIDSVSQAAYTGRMIEVASPRLIAADLALSRCAAITAAQGADLMGCGNNGLILKEWQKAVEAQEACREEEEASDDVLPVSP